MALLPTECLPQFDLEYHLLRGKKPCFSLEACLGMIISSLECGNCSASEIIEIEIIEESSVEEGKGIRHCTI